MAPFTILKLFDPLVAQELQRFCQFCLQQSKENVGGGWTIRSYRPLIER